MCCPDRSACRADDRSDWFDTLNWLHVCREQTIYKVSAIAASAAIIALAVGAVHYRFMWHMKQGHEFPTAEALATFCLVLGGIVSTCCDREQLQA